MRGLSENNPLKQRDFPPAPGTKSPAHCPTPMITPDSAALVTQMTDARAPAIDKVRYSHTDMIDFIIANPHVSQNAIAMRYGYTPAWVSRVITSDVFQSQMALRREEIIDPDLRATCQERFQALVHLSLQRLMGMLEQPTVKPEVALRALELGAKSLGMGAALPTQQEPEGARLERLAHRLIDLQSNVRQRTVEIPHVEVIPQAS